MSKLLTGIIMGGVAVCIVRVTSEIERRRLEKQTTEAYAHYDKVITELVDKNHKLKNGEEA